MGLLVFQIINKMRIDIERRFSLQPAAQGGDADLHQFGFDKGDCRLHAVHQSAALPHACQGILVVGVGCRSQRAVRHDPGSLAHQVGHQFQAGLQGLWSLGKPPLVLADLGQALGNGLQGGLPGGNVRENAVQIPGLFDRDVFAFG